MKEILNAGVPLKERNGDQLVTVNIKPFDEKGNGNITIHIQNIQRDTKGHCRYVKVRIYPYCKCLIFYSGELYKITSLVSICVTCTQYREQKVNKCLF